MLNKEDCLLLVTDLSARLPYKVIVNFPDIFSPQITKDEILSAILVGEDGCYRVDDNYGVPIEYVRPYLRSLSTMTSEEAKDIAFLWGIDTERILNINVSEKYIDIIIDDGFCSTETITIWFEDIVSSIKIFDYLNSHYFDYRGLIPRLAIEAPKGMYRFNK